MGNGQIFTGAGIVIHGAAPASRDASNSGVYFNDSSTAGSAYDRQEPARISGSVILQQAGKV
jgi:hypothetical protein